MPACKDQEEREGIEQTLLTRKWNKNGQCMAIRGWASYYGNDISSDIENSEYDSMKVIHKE